MRSRLVLTHCRQFRMTFVGKHFKWREGAPSVKHISLRSMYQESGPVSYIREALALRVLKDAGVPSSEARYVRCVPRGSREGPSPLMLDA